MYKVSVIMPIYNNETTLRSAIDSILNQSVFDFELLLINDGSTDSSSRICMEYEKREPLLVEVIHQNRLGFATARNRGLNRAKGSYIYFADARDIFAPRMLETNVRLAEEQNAELVVFGFSETNESNQEVIKHIPNLPFLLSKNRFRNHFRNFHYFFPYELCNKLYKIKYLREKRIQFHEFPLKEEFFFSLDVYKDLNKVVFNRRVFIRRAPLKKDNISKYKKDLFNIHIDLVKHLKKIFVYWEKIEEYQDLIVGKYYQLLETEVLNLMSPSLNLSNKELGKKIRNILSDDRISNVLDERNELYMKKIYERVLWESFRKGDSRAIIKLVERKIKTDKITENIKGKFKKWFD